MPQNSLQASVNYQDERFDYTFLVYGMSLVPPLLMLAVIAWQSVVPVAFLTKDPLAVAELTKGECCSVYYGILSNVGILLWCSAAAITLFALLFALTERAERSATIFFATAGFFTSFLMLDDFFLVHEDVFPAFGVSQIVTYGLYAAFAVVYFITCWFSNLVLRPRLLFVALCCLGLSVALDIALHSESRMHILLEDGAKIIGIAAWAGFHIEAAFVFISKHLRQKIPLGRIDLARAQPKRIGGKASAQHMRTQVS